uniref:Amidinotransferase n=1 Tax=Ditylenchus dipsaci TaxID=166011 RepID=A0A915CUJ2_9BILA
VKYSINPWMDPCTAVDNTKAMKQWETLRQSIVQAGPTGADLYPDLVFTANAAVVRNKKSYIANFFYPERKGENYFYKRWFQETWLHHMPRSGDPFRRFWRCSLGGQNQNKLFCGIGPRTDVRALKNVAEKLKDVELPFKAYGLRLIDPRFYHIDTCFCPLTDDLALYYPHAFDPISRHNLANELELVPVDEQDACRFACNAVVVGKTVIMHQGSENTAKMLEKIGFKTHFLDMSEFIKSGGSAKCCTLRL